MKTSFSKNLKQGLFLLIAVLFSFNGIAQTVPSNLSNVPIGGSKTPDPGPYTKRIATLVSGYIFTDIENRQTVPAPVAETLTITGTEKSKGFQTQTGIVTGGKQDPDLNPISLQNVLVTGGESTKPTLKMRLPVKASKTLKGLKFLKLLFAEQWT